MRNLWIIWAAAVAKIPNPNPIKQLKRSDGEIYFAMANQASEV